MTRRREVMKKQLEGLPASGRNIFFGKLFPINNVL